MESKYSLELVAGNYLYMPYSGYATHDMICRISQQLGNSGHSPYLASMTGRSVRPGKILWISQHLDPREEMRRFITNMCLNSLQMVLFILSR